MINVLDKLQYGLLRAVGLSVAVLVTASCQNDDSLAADSASSNALLSIPSSIKISRAFEDSKFSSELFVNGTLVASTISRSDTSGFNISAEFLIADLNRGTNTNSLNLNIMYECGLNDSNLTLVSLTKEFSYSTEAISITATSDFEPDEDGDTHSNHKECRDGTLAYDANSPVPPVDPPTTGSALFSVGIANNRFYDSDTNDSKFLSADGAIQAVNDNFSQAQVIGSGSETTGYVSKNTDEGDYYFITGSGARTVSLVSANSNADLDLHIYNDDFSLAYSSTGLTANESLSDLYLPFYILVHGFSDDTAGHGSLYRLVTSAGGASVRSTAVARFQLNLINSSGNTLSGDGRYSAEFIVNGATGSRQVSLSNVPVGTYRYQIHSDTDQDNGNFDSFYGMGVEATGSITITGGQTVSEVVTLE